MDVKKDIHFKPEKVKKHISKANLHHEEEKEDNEKNKKNTKIKKVITKKNIKNVQEKNYKVSNTENNEESPQNNPQPEILEQTVINKDNTLDDTFIVRKIVPVVIDREVTDDIEYRDSLNNLQYIHIQDSYRTDSKSQKEEYISHDHSISNVIEEFVKQIMTPKSKGNLKEEMVVPMIIDSVIISERITKNLSEEKVATITAHNEEYVKTDSKNENETAAEVTHAENSDMNTV